MTEDIFQLSNGVSLSILDTSNRQATFLAQLPQNRQLQLSEKLYQLLSCLVTPLSLSALASAYQTQTGEALTETQITQLVYERLLPYQLVQNTALAVDAPVEAENDAVRPETSRSILSIHLRRDVLPARVIEPIARRLSVLFNRPLSILLLICVGLVHILAYRALGIPPTDPLDPAVMPLAYSLFIVSVLIHEFGHLAACHRWGCPHGALGVGLYFVSPVFYVDVSPAWKLPRWQRLVVDGGGMYLQLLFTIPMLLLYGLSQQPLFLWVIVFIDLAIAFNLNPIAKYDGYWMLSDGLGVPNLHRRAAEAIRYTGRRLLWHMGLSDEPPMRSSFTQHFGRALYSVIAVYGFLLIVAAAFFMTVILPLLLQLALTLPDVIGQNMIEMNRSLQTADLLGALGRLADTLWNLFLVLSIGVLLMWPIRRVMALVKWSRIYLMGERRTSRVFVFGNMTGFAAGLAFTALMLLIFRPNLSIPAPTWLQAGDVAPNFVTTDLNGNTRQLSDYKGQVVVLKFWSPTCVHCRAEAPAVSRAYETLGQDVAFLTVALGSKADIEAFVEEHNTAYPVLLDETQTIVADYQIPGFPFTYVISPEGVISKATFGSQRDGQLEQDVQTVQAAFCSTTDSVCTVNPALLTR